MHHRSKTTIEEKIRKRKEKEREMDGWKDTFNL
jgi:hypothetical protein